MAQKILITAMTLVLTISPFAGYAESNGGLKMTDQGLQPCSSSLKDVKEPPRESRSENSRSGESYSTSDQGGRSRGNIGRFPNKL
jgi:hypothetical protein